MVRWNIGTEHVKTQLSRCTQIRETRARARFLVRNGKK